MQGSARQFVRKVLLIHLVLIIAVTAMTILAAREVYRRAHRQALEQAQRRQELIASQTARGIENYYRMIMSDLDLLNRSEEDVSAYSNSAVSGLRAESRMGGVIWWQIRNRAANLIMLNRTPLKIATLYDTEQREGIESLVQNSAAWLREVDGPSVSPLTSSVYGPVHLLAAPTPGNRRMLVAVVPVRRVESLFFKHPAEGSKQSLDFLLVDESGQVLATSNEVYQAARLNAQIEHAELRSLVECSIAVGKAGTTQITLPLELPQGRIKPSLMTAEPILLPDRKWSVVVFSPLAEADQVVLQVFRRAFYWTLFVILAVTGILISTSVQLIRSRIRLSRLQHQVLTQELVKAREIQMAWLPDPNNKPPAVDIAAMNRPASHISGDFYNWFELPDGRVTVVIGDVTGHGMAAAFLMSTTQMLIRSTMLRLKDPGPCLEEVNRTLCMQMFNGQFVTLQVLLLDLKGGRMSLATAGHPAPLWSLQEGDRFENMPLEAQLVLGVDSDARYTTEHFAVTESTNLLLYTDGVVEMESKDRKKRFNISGLVASLNGSHRSAQLMIDQVARATDEFRGELELADDLTLVALRVKSLAPADDESFAEIGMDLIS